MDEDEEINKAHHESSKTKTEQISTEASTNWIESSDSLNYFIRSSNDHHNESNILNEFGWNFNPESNHNHLITTNINNSSSSSDQMDLDRRLEYLTASNYSSRSPPDDQILPSVPARSTDFKVSNPSVSSSSSEEVLPEKSIESADRELPDKPATKGRKKGAKRIRQQRFAFMTKSDIDHLEDGYRWRKYGQKAVKNSPYPRSYYRCTNSNCTVKKRVERSSEDPTIVITTYEGQHCHHISSGFLRNTGGIHHLFSSHDLNRSSSTSGPTQIISSNRTSASSNDPYNIPRNMMQFPLSDDQLLGQNELLRPASLSLSSPSQVSMENVGLNNLPRSTTDEGLLGDIVSAEMRR